MTQIMIVGDPHADLNFLNTMFSRATSYGVTTVILLGDIGMYWPGPVDVVKDISDLATLYQLFVYCIDGNHDNHDVLNHDAKNFVTIAPRVSYIPRGFAWTWSNTKFLAMGGAWSIDQDRRTPHVTWWPNEEPNEDQIERAIAVGKVDIVLAHDAPQVASIPGYTYIGPWAEKTRINLGKIWESSQCKAYYHGHWHCDYVDIIDGRRIQGLHCNISPSRAWRILEV